MAKVEMMFTLQHAYRYTGERSILDYVLTNSKLINSY